MAIIGRINEDMTFETCEQKTSEDIPRERLVTLLVFILCWLLLLGVPALVNLGKTLFFVEPIIY